MYSQQSLSCMMSQLNSPWIYRSHIISVGNRNHSQPFKDMQWNLKYTASLVWVSLWSHAFEGRAGQGKGGHQGRCPARYNTTYGLSPSISESLANGLMPLSLDAQRAALAVQDNDNHNRGISDGNRNHESRGRHGNNRRTAGSRETHAYGAGCLVTTNLANKASAARAQAGRQRQRVAAAAAAEPVTISDNEAPDPAIASIEVNGENFGDEDIKCTGWTGRDSDDEWEDQQTDREPDDENDVEELEGDALVNSIQQQCELEMDLDLEQLSKGPSLYEKIMVTRSSKDWKRAGQKCGLGYNGQSDSGKHEKARKANAANKVTAKMRDRLPNLCPSSTVWTKIHLQVQSQLLMMKVQSHLWLKGYLSDEPDEDWDEEEEWMNELNVASSSSGRRKLDVPACESRKRKKEEKKKAMEKGLLDIERLIASKKDLFAAGRNSLQAYRARSIQSCLHMIVCNGCGKMDASVIAAAWGVVWFTNGVATWLTSRDLPTNDRGSHKKYFSLLDDPAICTELHAYLRTNKWSMNPGKLAESTKNKLLPDEAKKYLHHVVDQEMLNGLKKYLELEFFHIFILEWGKESLFELHTVGFTKKVSDTHLTKRHYIMMGMNAGVYSGNEGTSSLIDIEKEQAQELPFPLRWLVLIAHDEMTVQANDSNTKSQVFQGEQSLKKKGVDRGLYCSDVICSTFSHLLDAGQSLEYGKNYEGYWTHELFVKQLQEKVIPAFEEAHGPAFQALIMVDNS
ncbi:hypothetical protein C8J56DRAFT_896344 [Mycena floridula]|nr:hypothetical protein C8J56DRAFT_896344 [Mycena floridula]